MNQLAIEFNPVRLARKTDPATSKEAAERVREFFAGHAQKVLDCLKAHGPQTPEQIGARIGLDPYAIRKRLPELERAGFAQPTGETAPTASGRSQRVWRAV